MSKAAAINRNPTINDYLPDDLHVEPLEEGKSAEFRLTRAGFMNPFATPPTLMNPQGHMLPGRDIIKTSSGPVEINNITGYNPIKTPGRETVYDPEFGSVFFPRSGSIFCTPEDNNMYMFLKLNNKNRDNPNRNRKYPVVFYEVDLNRDIQKSGSNFDYRRFAYNIIGDADSRELLSIAFNLNELNIDALKVDMNGGASTLKVTLGQIADNYSKEIIMASDDEMAKLRVYVDTAIAQIAIMAVKQSNETTIWKWQRKAGQAGKQQITVIEKGNDPIKGLIDFLKDDKGADHRAEILLRFKDTEKE